MGLRSEFFGQALRAAIVDDRVNCNPFDLIAQTLISMLSELDRSENLRIDGKNSNGKNNGGVLHLKSRDVFRHPKLQRVMCRRNENKAKEPAASGIPDEVAFTRGLFNGGTLGGLELVAYEAPLMRKRDDKKNKGINKREVSCDLVGLGQHEICCIEVKTNPANEATQLPTAFAEAFSYAVCLWWIANNRKSEFLAELQDCRKYFVEKDDPISLPKIVTFGVAIPEKYLGKFSAQHKTQAINAEKKIQEFCKVHKDELRFKGVCVIPSKGLQPGVFRGSEKGKMVCPKLEFDNPGVKWEKSVAALLS